jgi:tetratricopeptide (TPR) repeat protein
MSENPGDLDDQQARLVERLRAARGEPVTFDELRAIGIENPALLCYELAAVGLPITRTSSPAEGMPALSVRLEPEQPSAPLHDAACEPEPEAGELLTARLAAALEVAKTSPLALLRRARTISERLTTPAPGSLAERGLKPAALVAMLALIGAFGAVIAIALGDLANNPAPRTVSQRASARGAAGSSRRQEARHAPVAPGRAQPKAPLPGAGYAAAPVPISPAAAVALEAEGHQLLVEGSYASAVPALASAIRASGQSLADCMRPASEACLTFAYALYDLGRALRLEGRHAEAVSILSERLRIDNQRPTVQRELELARASRA